MKKILILFLAINASYSFSQSVQELSDKLKVLEDKNAALNEKLTFCNLYSKSEFTEIKSFNPNFDFKVIECLGNSSDQTVEVVFTISHSLPNQNLILMYLSKRPQAIGETGMIYDFKSANIPIGSSPLGGHPQIQFPTNILIKGKLTFRNILPQTEKLAIVNGQFSSENQDGGGNKTEGQFEIRNLKITWK